MLSKNKASRRFEIVCLAVILLLSPILIMESSPLFQTPNVDSCLFMSIGKGITEGKVPYVDLIENKGPLFFLMQAFAQWLFPGLNGRFVRESWCCSFTAISFC